MSRHTKAVQNILDEVYKHNKSQQLSNLWHLLPCPFSAIEFVTPAFTNGIPQHLEVTSVTMSTDIPKLVIRKGYSAMKTPGVCVCVFSLMCVCVCFLQSLNTAISKNAIVAALIFAVTVSVFMGGFNPSNSKYFNQWDRHFLGYMVAITFFLSKKV
jgi:hypothetical protein